MVGVNIMSLDHTPNHEARSGKRGNETITKDDRKMAFTQAECEQTKESVQDWHGKVWCM